MTPHYADEWLTVYQGDARDVLPSLPGDSVDCIVTSPPYWGLRDYGTASWSGGDAGCDHLAPSSGTRNQGRDRAASGGTFHDSPRVESTLPIPFRGTCGKCGATRQDSQLGLEATPEQYVANLVAVFRELRRVLKPSGTCWLNLGDSYAATHHGKGGASTSEVFHDPGDAWRKNVVNERREFSIAPGLKPKDLVGIPWRVAFALQADGWYLRSEITWCKPNAMPESVTDRPTSATEKLFLLTKRPVYYFDSEAARERVASVVQTPNAPHQGVVLGDHLRAQESAPEGSISPSGMADTLVGFWDRIDETATVLEDTQLQDDIGLPSLDSEEWTEFSQDGDSQFVSGRPIAHRPPLQPTSLLNTDGSAEQSLEDGDGIGIALSDDDLLRVVRGPSELPDPPLVNGDRDAAIGVDHASSVGQKLPPIHNEKYTADGVTSSRNIRNWWVIPSRPYKGAHFAVFPPELPERCIKAGSSERGVCPECGAPWEREIALGRVTATGGSDEGRLATGGHYGTDDGNRARRNATAMTSREHVTTGWADPCGNDLDPEPAIVLDPFAGSGTTGMVANRLSRRAILIDLNANYLRQQMARNAQTPLGLGA